MGQGFARQLARFRSIFQDQTVGLERIASYIGLDPTFPSLDALEAALRANFASLGQLSDVQFRKMARDIAREKPGGGANSMSAGAGI